MSGSSTSDGPTVTPTLLPCSIPPCTTAFDGKLWDPQVGPAAAATPSTTTTTTPSGGIAAAAISSSSPLPAGGDGDSNDAAATQVTAFFRGRRLIGREVQLPEGCSGIIVDQAHLDAGRKSRPKAAAPPSEDEEPEVIDIDDDDDDNDDYSGRGARSRPELRADVSLPEIRARHRFGAMRVLGHDELPADDSALLRAVGEWVGVARAMHQH